jgi:hypothetical protein
MRTRPVPDPCPSAAGTTAAGARAATGARAAAYPCGTRVQTEGDAVGVRECGGRCESDSVHESGGVRKSGGVREKMAAGSKAAAGSRAAAGARATAGAIAAVSSRELDWEQSGRKGMKKVETTPWQPRN